MNGASGKCTAGEHLLLIAYRLDVLQYIAEKMGLPDYERVRILVFRAP